MKQVSSALRAQIGGAPDVAGGGTGDPVTAMVPAPTAYEQKCTVGFVIPSTSTTGDCTNYSNVCPTGLYFIKKCIGGVEQDCDTNSRCTDGHQFFSKQTNYAWMAWNQIVRLGRNVHLGHKLIVV